MAEPPRDLADALAGLILWGALGDASGAPWELRYKADGPFFPQAAYPANGSNVLDGGLIYPVRIGKYKHAVGELAYTEYPAGLVSDDTSMTATLINDIISHQGKYSGRSTNVTSSGQMFPQGVVMTTGDIIIAYMAWASGGYYKKMADSSVTISKGCPFLGSNSRNLFKITPNKQGLCDFKIDKYESRFIKHQYASASLGCGAIMRAAPLCIYKVPPLTDDFYSYAGDIDCRASNNNFYSLICNRLYLLMIREVILNPSAKTVEIVQKCVDYLQPAPQYIQDVIRYLFTNAYYCVHASDKVSPPQVYSRKYSPNELQTIHVDLPGCTQQINFPPYKGSCGAAIWACFYALYLSEYIIENNALPGGHSLAHINTDPYHNLILVFERIVSFRGDTDSDCKVSGALLGARYGIKKLYPGQVKNFATLFAVNTEFLANYQYQVAELMKYFEK